MLFSVHMMGSAFLNISELAITDDEAKQLAKAITDVSEHYDVPLIDDKTMAWVNLAMVAGGVYGTRLATLVMDGKKKKAAQPKIVSMPFQSPHAAQN